MIEIPGRDSDITPDLYSVERTGELVTSASDCGFGPGHWPTRLWVEMPNGQRKIFLRDRPRVENGEIVCWRYHSLQGSHTLTVIND